MIAACETTWPRATISTLDLDAQTDYYSRALGLSIVERSKGLPCVFLVQQAGHGGIELVRGKPERADAAELAPGRAGGSDLKARSPRRLAVRTA